LNEGNESNGNSKSKISNKKYKLVFKGTENIKKEEIKLSSYLSKEKFNNFNTNNTNTAREVLLNF
jgi:hypothetical protein